MSDPNFQRAAPGSPVASGRLRCSELSSHPLPPNGLSVVGDLPTQPERHDLEDPLKLDRARCWCPDNVALPLFT